MFCFSLGPEDSSFNFSFPKTAPQTVEGQMGLGTSENTMTDNRSFSAPAVKQPARPGSSDSSENRSGASSSLTGLTSASDIQRGGSPEAAAAGNTNNQNIDTAKGPALPTEMVNPLELMSEPGMEPRPPSVPRPVSRDSHNRPGSSKHKVLPPITTQSRPIELK